VCVLDLAGFEEGQTSGLRNNYKLKTRNSGNVAIGICKEDCIVNVIRTVTE